jgi:transposase
MAVSYRQTKRLYRRYQVEGAKGLQHRSAGRCSNAARDDAERSCILALVREKYSGSVDDRFGPTLAAEHLASEDGVHVHHDTLRRWMLAAGLWSRTRKRSPYRRRREPKAHFGELVQLDGSFHPWFEKRGPDSCLRTMVDDATGRSTGRFSAPETIWAAVAVLRDWIEAYGIPQALYTDWKNVYVRGDAAARLPAVRAGSTRMGAGATVKTPPVNTAGAWDAKNASTSSLETQRTVFHSAHKASC